MYGMGSNEENEKLEGKRAPPTTQVQQQGTKKKCTIQCSYRPKAFLFSIVTTLNVWLGCAPGSLPPLAWSLISRLHHRWRRRNQLPSLRGPLRGGYFPSK